MGMSISPPTIFRIIHRHVKNETSGLAVFSKPKREIMADISFFIVTQFVFADEVGCDRRDNIRKFGYSLRGETPVYCRNFQHGERISVIAAACKCVKGSVNGDIFLDYLLGTLVPQMLAYDGESP